MFGNFETTASPDDASSGSPPLPASTVRAARSSVSTMPPIPVASDTFRRPTD